MSEADFVTVFNVTDDGYRNWWFPAFGLIFVAIGVLMPWLVKSGFLSSKRPVQPWFRWFFLSFAILWTLGSSLMTYIDYRSARRALLSGEAEYVQGIVEDFREVPHKSESFTVNGISFQYSDNVISAGFNHTASYGEPIKPGIYVRIWYYDTKRIFGHQILKLQIQRKFKQS